MKEQERIAGFLQMKSWSSDQFCSKGTIMNKTDKILIAGASGMVGSAILRYILKQGFDNVVGT